MPRAVPGTYPAAPSAIVECLGFLAALSAVLFLALGLALAHGGA